MRCLLYFFLLFYIKKIKYEIEMPRIRLWSWKMDQDPNILCKKKIIRIRLLRKTDPDPTIERKKGYESNYWEKKGSDPAIEKKWIWICPSRETRSEPDKEPDPGQKLSQCIQNVCRVKRIWIQLLRKKGSGYWEKMDPDSTIERKQIWACQRTGSGAETTPLYPERM